MVISAMLDQNLVRRENWFFPVFWSDQFTKKKLCKMKNKDLVKSFPMVPHLFLYDYWFACSNKKKIQ